MGTGASKSRIRSGVSAGSSGAAGRAHSSRRSRPHSRSSSSMSAGCPLRLDMIRLSGITEQGYTYMWDSKTGQLRVWCTPAGDGLGAFLISTPPALPTRAASLEELAGHCPALHAAVKGRGHPSLVELSVVQLAGGYRALRIITKTRQRALRAHAFTGAFLIPFRDTAIVIKVECEESSSHGSDRGCTGANRITDDASAAADTDPAAADPSLSSTDSSTADGQGSGVEEGHSSKDPPLTRAQRVLADVEGCLLLHPCCATLAPLQMPLLQKASPLLAGPAAAAAAAAGLFADHRGGQPKHEAVARKTRSFGGVGCRQHRALAAMGPEIADV